MATTRAIRRTKLQSECHHQQTNTQFFTCHSCHPTNSVFTAIINCGKRIHPGHSHKSRAQFFQFLSQTVTTIRCAGPTHCQPTTTDIIMLPPLIDGGIKRCFCLTSVCLSDVCLSVTYIGPKSRTEKPRKTTEGGEGHIMAAACLQLATTLVNQSVVQTTLDKRVCLFVWGLTSLSAQIGYIAP